MKKIFLFIALCGLSLVLTAQEIPVLLEYTQIYSFLDELATDGIIDVNTAIKPYTRKQIAMFLNNAQQKDTLLNARQQKDLIFFLNEYALERDTMVDNFVQYTDNQTFNISLADPQFSYLTPKKNFKMRLRPILGAEVYSNKKGTIVKRWWGADLQMDIAQHVSIWSSLRDKSWNGTWGLKDSYYPTENRKAQAAKLTRSVYLNNLAGAEYKNANYGGDYADFRGGISFYTSWGSIAVQRESIRWGDAYHCSNILSGRAPAFPTISLNVKPCKWFEFNYFHGWLVSNRKDSTNYYLENDTIKHFRPHNKFMAANMFSFTPIHHLHISFGNSIIYAERNVQPAYFIPFALFKSLDHLLTNGTNTQNQNSQLFFSLSTRNIKHLHLYASVFFDEIKWNRFKLSNDERNPTSYLLGFNWSGWPITGLSLKGEFCRTNIICYKHSIDVLKYSSNDYNLGHYMGDNAQNIFVELSYKPIRGLSLAASYSNEKKYNEYYYLRRNIAAIISQKPFDNLIYRNDIVAFDAIFEAHPNMYLTLNVAYNHSRANDRLSANVEGEDTGKAVMILGTYSPTFFQGKNWTTSIAFSFNY